MLPICSWPYEACVMCQGPQLSSGIVRPIMEMLAVGFDHEICSWGQWSSTMISKRLSGFTAFSCLLGLSPWDARTASEVCRLACSQEQRLRLPTGSSTADTL